MNSKKPTRIIVRIRGNNIKDLERDKLLDTEENLTMNSSNKSPMNSKHKGCCKTIAFGSTTNKQTSGTRNKSRSKSPVSSN